MGTDGIGVTFSGLQLRVAVRTGSMGRLGPVARKWSIEVGLIDDDGGCVLDQRIATVIRRSRGRGRFSFILLILTTSDADQDEEAGEKKEEDDVSNGMKDVSKVGRLSLRVSMG